MISNNSLWAALRDLEDNTVVPVTNAGAPTNGTSGTGANLCGPGTPLFDTVNKVAYINQGTLASPIWNLYTPNSTAISGLGVLGLAKAQYDFSVDGGAISTITPAKNAIIPSKAIILGGIIDVLTTFVGATATISIGTSAGSSAASLKAATAVASYTAGLLAVVPVFTAATMVKMSAAGQVTLTIATAALTAGKANVIIAYVMSN